MATKPPSRRRKRGRQPIMRVEAFIALGRTPFDLYGRRTDRLPAPTSTHPLTEERLLVLQRRAELRQPLYNPADENRPPRRQPSAEPCDQEDDTLISQAQMARLVGLSRQRLWQRMRDCRGMFPRQVEQHACRDGQDHTTCAYWLYREVRPWLEDMFGLTLPARYRGISP